MSVWPSRIWRVSEWTVTCVFFLLRRIAAKSINHEVCCTISSLREALHARTNIVACDACLSDLVTFGACLSDRVTCGACLSDRVTCGTCLSNLVACGACLNDLVTFRACLCHMWLVTTSRQNVCFQCSRFRTRLCRTCYPSHSISLLLSININGWCSWHYEVLNFIF